MTLAERAICMGVRILFRELDLQSLCAFESYGNMTDSIWVALALECQDLDDKQLLWRPDQLRVSC